MFFGLQLSKLGSKNLKPNKKDNEEFEWKQELCLNFQQLWAVRTIDKRIFIAFSVSDQARTGTPGNDSTLLLIQMNLSTSLRTTTQKISKFLLTDGRYVHVLITSQYLVVIILDWTAWLFIRLNFE